MKTETDTRFPYMVTVTAPKEYPIEVHLGYLTDDKKEVICGVPKAGKTASEWQNSGAEAGQGSDIIPSHLSLTYLAYAEKKFYKVEGELPKDKILAAFQKGFPIQDKPSADGSIPWIHGTYDQLTIGAAPGGVVVVWLDGNHHRIEICRLQAKEVFVNKDEFRPNPDPEESQQQFFDTFYNVAVSDSVKNEISKNGIPFGLWDKYRVKYKYRFVLKPYDEDDVITKLYRLNYNGESEYLIGTDQLNVYKDDAVPYEVTFMFKKYNADIVFNDTELLKIFENFKGKYPGKPLDIILEPSFMYNDIKIYVQCGDDKVQLEKAKIKEIWGG
ncbi:hypothetical protein M2347_003607 [Chryseobacterium sp. H1D6B]|uniref:DUF2931 family protein n=1 Tax=Chryseobacterium sp. H1D6B TaxID=2940588 RepID=UPI00182E3766|nr:DUF2931 family protein [Chryseobacterium sp. H1D6B]MDH6253880.1 hypothetical protein [Chryseobacterium sp. H1D6B]